MLNIGSETLDINFKLFWHVDFAKACDGFLLDNPTLEAREERAAEACEAEEAGNGGEGREDREARVAGEQKSKSNELE